jgi:hypothetical protein
MVEAHQFVPFPKVPRLSREIIITEKIDGTNASIFVESCATLRPDEDVPDFAIGTALLHGQSYYIGAGSRKRWIKPGSDNFGFARWAADHLDELVQLGEGHHFGEWWGKGVQRGYGQDVKKFSLFNVGRWYGNDADVIGADDRDPAPACCEVVPVLYRGGMMDLYYNNKLKVTTTAIQSVLDDLSMSGSVAAPGYMNPEGIMIFHSGRGDLFKKTFEGDAHGKDSAVRSA